MRTHWFLGSGLFVVQTFASPVPLPTTNDDTTTASQSSGWSREAVLTLVGICTAILCFLIGLGSRRMRKLIGKGYTCK